MIPLTASIFPYDLEFIKPAKTSRNTLTHKKLWILELRQGERKAYGEISPFVKLSLDDVPGFEDKLTEIIRMLNEGVHPKELELQSWPSIRFGVETAFKGLAYPEPFKIFDSKFYSGELQIPINGLIWMASKEDMFSQIETKIAQGFRCIKLKVGAIDFDEECRLLEAVRKKYSAFKVELRVDANGAFPAADALEMLNDLHRFELHSIEQPIKAGQYDDMQRLCREARLDIALDEELLGLDPLAEGDKMLNYIRPKYIILKPGLLGGFTISDEWINNAEALSIGWWITSALESNIGLNAIAQYTSMKEIAIPQGLGTGQLYKNNIPSPLEINQGYLINGNLTNWKLPEGLL